MTEELQQIKTVLEEQLALRTMLGVDAVCAVFSDVDLRRKLQAEPSFAYVIFATFIYREEKLAGAKHLLQTIFSDVSTFSEIEEKINCLKFLLWNIEFDVESEKACNTMKEAIANGNISRRAVEFLIDSYSFDKQKVTKAVFA